MLSAEVAELAQQIANGDERLLESARVIAEAEIDLMRVRRLRAALTVRTMHRAHPFGWPKAHLPDGVL